MKTFLLITSSLIYAYTGFPQNIAGSWHGDIFGSDGSTQGYNEIIFFQKDSNISGRISAYINGEMLVQYVILGKVSGDNVTFKATKVISHRIRNGGYLCLIDVDAQLLIYQDGSNSIEGTASHIVFPINGNSGTPCPSVRFKINKLIDKSKTSSVPAEVSPAVESTITGQVFDRQTLKPIKSTLSVVGNKSALQIIPTRNDGTYTFKAPINDISVILIAVNGYEPLRESITIDKSNITKNFFLILKPAIIQPPVKLIIERKLNEPVALKNVLFNESLPTLLPQSFPELDKLVSLMQTKSTMMIRLEGHTDRIGDADKNLKLSQDRVITVKRYLVKKGISETRIDTKGYSDTKPICTPSDKGKPCEANRRVEFVVTEQ